MNIDKELKTAKLQKLKEKFEQRLLKRKHLDNPEDIDKVSKEISKEHIVFNVPIEKIKPQKHKEEEYNILSEFIDEKAKKIYIKVQSKFSKSDIKKVTCKIDRMIHFLFNEKQNEIVKHIKNFKMEEESYSFYKSSEYRICIYLYNSTISMIDKRIKLRLTINSILSAITDYLLINIQKN